MKKAIPLAVGALLILGVIVARPVVHGSARTAPRPSPVVQHPAETRAFTASPPARAGAAMHDGSLREIVSTAIAASIRRDEPTVRAMVAALRKNPAKARALLEERRDASPAAIDDLLGRLP